MFKQMQFLTFLLLLFTFMSCDDQVPDDPNKPPELPPLTMEGKNTLGCKINGKNWVASVGFNLSGDQAFRMGYDSASGHFGINSWWIDKSKGIEQNLSFESIFSNQILNFHKLIFNPQDINYLVINNI